MTHQDLDRRSLALHRLVAEKMRRDPALLGIVRKNMARWRTIATPNDSHYLDEWDRLLQAGLDAALSVATSESESAQALRQSSPFTGILTARERFTFLKSWKASNATQ